jgi:hypothetical protein
MAACSDGPTTACSDGPTVLVVTDGEVLGRRAMEASTSWVPVMLYSVEGVAVAITERERSQGRRDSKAEKASN